MKIGVVGSGYVGSTAAFSLVLHGIGREIILVDKDPHRSSAEADDIRHAVPFAHPLTVRAGEYPDLKGCKVVLLCAGVNQKPGETRLQLLQRNAEVFAEIVPKIIHHEPEAILVVATNPVDVMTHVAAKYAAKCGIAAGRVLGSGTTLDTARFRSLLGSHFGIDSHHVHANVIGEHGDSEVLTWSLVTIAGIPITAFAQLRGIVWNEAMKSEMDGKVRGAAYHIIRGKGATYYGIGAALARIVNIILHDQRSILTVGCPADDVAGVADVTLALPRLLGGQGVLQTFFPPLAADEEEKLRNSARVIRSALDELE